MNKSVLPYRARVRDKNLKRKVYEREYNSVRNYKSGKVYLDSLFNTYSKLMVFRIDFGYIAEEREKITQEQARKDLERFLNNQRGNSLFKYMVGYIWKLEFGARKGLHFHFIIIFNGANVQKDVYVAWKVGEYWKNKIAPNRGSYWNCNLEKDKYKLYGEGIGIGTISHFERDKRRYFLNVLGYLTKKDQYLRLKTSIKCKSFGKGGKHQEKIGGAGRPRKNRM